MLFYFRDVHPRYLYFFFNRFSLRSSCACMNTQINGGLTERIPSSFVVRR